MSEISLPALGVAESTINSQPIKQINAALKECKFGLFHIKLLCTSFIGFVAGVLVSNSTSYLLASAECDLQMSLVHKGILNAMPYFGMVISSVVAGFLTDAFGRKMFVLVGFGGIFVFTLISGTSQTFEVLVFSKFFEGLLFATSFSAVVSLTAEFCHNDIRDRVLLFQSSFLALAQVVIPAMAWGILTKEWKLVLFNGSLVLNIWNIYLYFMSLWSLTAFILYWTQIPESPKFLVMQNKYDEARDILIKMYCQNTWKKPETYPHLNIWKDLKEKRTLKSLSETGTHRSVKHQLLVGLHNVKPMFMKPLVGYLFLLCLLCFMMMCLTNILRLWFPQLSTIVEHYKVNDDQNLCQMLDEYTQDLREKSLNKTEHDVCIPTKSGAETYINSIIVGAVSLFPYLVTGLLVNRVGKKALLMTLGTISVVTIFCISLANTKPAIVGLFSLSVAVTQICMSLNQAITIETFKTTQRTLAISLIMVSGRVGTLFGNIMFPILLDIECIIPFYAMTGLMAVVTLLALFLPKKNA